MLLRLLRVTCRRDRLVDETAVSKTPAHSNSRNDVTFPNHCLTIVSSLCKSAGFDILVKNCVAHNGAQQRLQLIDTNG